MLRELVPHWEYLAIGAGTYVEGEWVLLSAGALVHAGALSWPLVVLSATVGSVAWGQTWFWLGSFTGRGLLTRRAAWQPRALVLERWIARFGPLVVLFGRFVVGMGTVLPAMIGASGYAWPRFVVLDSIGALIWAASVTTVGFGVGGGLQRLLGQSFTWTRFAAAGLGVALLIWLLIRSYRALTTRSSARRLRGQA